MAREAITDELARSMLAKHGVSIIWKLHNDAATLHRAGNSIAAESFLRIADAAEREWLRREPAQRLVANSTGSARTLGGCWRQLIVA